MIQTVEIKGMGVNESEIKWVLTVPAMWLDPAKQVITEAAELVCFFIFSRNELSCFYYLEPFSPLFFVGWNFSNKNSFGIGTRDNVYTL